MESRKLAMAPQLAKVFAKLQSNNHENQKSTMTSFAHIHRGGPPQQKLGEIRENSESESCDCDNKEEKPTREMLHGPGAMCIMLTILSV